MALLSHSVEIQSKRLRGEKMKVKFTQSCLTLRDSLDCIVHGILQQEYWSGQPFPSLVDLSDAGIERRSPTLQGDSLSAGGFPGDSAGKESTCNTGDPSLIPRLGRSTGEGTSYPLQYSGLENSMIQSTRYSLDSCEDRARNMLGPGPVLVFITVTYLHCCCEH